LPLTVRHAAFEPASSLLSRLAARNGASSMQRFCGDIAFPIDPLFRGGKVAIEQLAQLAGCDLSALERVSIRHLGKGHFRLRDEFASLQSFQRTRIRVWATWLKSLSLGDEFEPLRDVVRRHIFDHFSVRRGAGAWRAVGGNGFAERTEAIFAKGLRQAQRRGLGAPRPTKRSEASPLTAPTRPESAMKRSRIGEPMR